MSTVETPAARRLPADWPMFSSDGRWPATRNSLHLISQMLGKLRLALAPTLPGWAHAPLALGRAA